MTALDIQSNAAAVAHRAAEWLTGQALARPGPFALCLSGGSTPKALYTLLAAPPFRDRFPWDRTHIFFGDERFVPAGHPDSNYRMAREALLSRVPLPPDQIHPFPTDGAPEDAARRYAGTLQNFYGATGLDPAKPLFDVTLLGLGEDGHTASLFPGVAALEEQTAWTAAVIGAKPEPRLTLTYPALNSSRTAAFLAVGPGKRAMLSRILDGDAELPAARIAPVGRILWFIDSEAAPSREAA